LLITRARLCRLKVSWSRAQTSRIKHFPVPGFYRERSGLLRSAFIWSERVFRCDSPPFASGFVAVNDLNSQLLTTCSIANGQLISSSTLSKHPNSARRVLNRFGPKMRFLASKSTTTCSRLQPPEYLEITTARSPNPDAATLMMSSVPGSPYHAQ
jgi:hypothetical protein